MPNFAAAFNNRGSVLLEMRRFGDALSCFDRALALRPGDIEVINNRGNALQGLARYDEALAAYDQALALNPDHVSALNNRGSALQQLKRHEEALASFDKAGSPQAFGGAAMAALNLCDWDRADSDRRGDGTAHPGGRVRVALGVCWVTAATKRCSANARRNVIASALSASAAAPGHRALPPRQDPAGLHLLRCRPSSRRDPYRAADRKPRSQRVLR